MGKFSKIYEGEGNQITLRELAGFLWETTFLSEENLKANINLKLEGNSEKIIEKLKKRKEELEKK